MKEFDHMTPTALELMCNKKWLESRIAEQDRYIDGYLSQDWRAFYERIELTDEEIKEAILEGKIKKYFKEKNKPLLGGKRKPES